MSLRAIATKTGLVFLGLVLALGAAEIGARLLLEPQQSVHVDDFKARTAEKKELQTKEQEHGIDVLIDWSGQHGVRLFPDVRAEIKDHRLSHRDIEIVTNSLGLRYPELGPKQPDEYRVLVMGDSITLGDYAASNETFPGQLESLAAGRAKKIRFINAGLPGASTEDEFYHYLEIQNAIQPDLVLVAMYLNDAQSGDRPFYATRIPPPFNYSRLALWLGNRFSVLRAILWQHLTVEGQTAMDWRETFRHGRDLHTGDMLNDPDAFDFEIYNAASDFGLAWNEKMWERLTYLTDVFSRSVQQNNQKFAVFLLPIHIQVKGNVENFYPQEQFTAMCSNLSIPCFDVLPGLRKVWAKDHQEMYFDQCHMTPYGNAEVAKLLIGWLNARGLVPN